MAGWRRADLTRLALSTACSSRPARGCGGWAAVIIVAALWLLRTRTIVISSRFPRMIPRLATTTGPGQRSKTTMMLGV
jgi:hypothetical protein